jgi:flagellar capping protein FliD
MSNGIGSGGGQLSDIYQNPEGNARLFRKQNGFSPDQILKAKKAGNDIREKKFTDKIEQLTKEEAAIGQSDQYIRKLMVASQALSNPNSTEFPEEMDAFRSRKVTLSSSDPSVTAHEAVIVNSTAGALEGSFSIKIERVASRDKTPGTVVLPSKISNITANETRIYVRGTEIKIPANATLEEVSRAITAKQSDTHVQAFARKFSDTDYRIFMSCKNEGGKITFETIANKLTESFASNVTALNLAGTLVIGGTEKVITPTMTLTDIATLISTVPTFAAAVDGAGPYTLSVRENASPVILTDVAAEKLMGQLGLEESAATPDDLKAKYYLEGSADAYYSTTNHLEGLFDQTTIVLVQPTGNETITANITRNGEKVLGAINDFMEAYNELMTFATTQTAVDSANGNKPKEGAFLAKNRDFIQMINHIKKTFSNAVTGGVTGLNNISEIGIKKDANGLLTKDDSKLMDALSANLEGVEQIFAFISDNTTGGYFKTSAHPKQLPGHVLGKNIMVSLIKKADQTYSARLYLDNSGVISEDVLIPIGSTDIKITTAGNISINGPAGSVYEGFSFDYAGSPIATPVDPDTTLEIQGFKVSQGLGDVLTEKLKDVVRLEINSDEFKDQKNELNKVAFKTRSERLNQENRLKKLKERQARQMRREERKAERFQKDMGKVQDVMAAFTPMMMSMFGR